MTARYSIRLAVLLAMVAASLAAAPAALAQPPLNDDIANATEVVEPLPFQDVVDTSEATGADTDPGCVSEPGDPGNPTVWYSYTPSRDDFYQANTFGSDYDTTVSAYIDDGGELVQIACNDDTFGLQSAVTVEILAGETVFFMVGTFAGEPFGGELVFNVDVAPPPFEIALEVDAAGTTSRDGSATITGTVTCSGPAFVDLFAELSQTVGRFIIRGFGFDFFECDGATPFELTISGENGLFRGGRAELFIDAFGFGAGGDAFDALEQQIRLRGARR